MKMIFCIVLLSVLLCSCGSVSGDSTEPSKAVLIEGRAYDAVGRNVVVIPDIELHAELQNIMPESAEFVLQNESLTKQWYPQRFVVFELRVNKENSTKYDVIREVPHSDGVFWEDIQYVARPGSEASQTLRWVSFYGELDPGGLYLMEKEIFCENRSYTIGIVFSIPG